MTNERRSTRLSRKSELKNAAAVNVTNAVPIVPITAFITKTPEKEESASETGSAVEQKLNLTPDSTPNNNNEPEPIPGCSSSNSSTRSSNASSNNTNDNDIIRAPSIIGSPRKAAAAAKANGYGLRAVSKKSKAISKWHNNCPNLDSLRNKVDECILIKMKALQVRIVPLNINKLPLNLIKKLEARSATMKSKKSLQPVHQEVSSKREIVKASEYFGERYLTVKSSDIHGYGLFTKNPIRAGEMIIEYAGDVIDSDLALERQNSYGSQGIDNYVMQVEKGVHIDATMTGNCARFVNHSCRPNCGAQIITINKKKRVLIVALKDIRSGEELTYDYHFISDELIDCNCGSPKCRLFLNYNAGKLKLNKTVVKSLREEDLADIEEDEEEESDDDGDGQEEEGQAAAANGVTDQGEDESQNQIKEFAAAAAGVNGNGGIEEMVLGD